MLAHHKPLNAGFFRGVNSPELFKAFFNNYSAWDALKLGEQPTYEEIHQAWTALEHPQKRRMEEALSQINDIGREDGQELLLTYAEEAKVPNFRELTPQKLAMTLRLYYKSHFAKAYDYYNLEHVDNLKVMLGAEPAPCEPTEANKDSFKEKLRAALKKAAHGKDLKLEEGPHPEGKWVLVVPHEEYAKPDYEFDKTTPGPDPEIKTRDRRPVHELVLIYSPGDGVIKLKTGKGAKKAEIVASLFATELIHKPASHFRDADVIRFDPILRPGFKIAKLPGDRFEWATVKFIDYRLKSDTSVHRTSQIDNTDSGRRSALEDVSEPMSNLLVQKLGIEFRFPGNGKKARFTAMLSCSGRMNLDTTERGRYVDSVLTREGFINVNARPARESVVPVGQAV